MLAGSRSFAAIAEWIADLPATARADLGLAGPIPAASTLWRLLTAINPTALQDAVGTWLRARLTWQHNRADRRRHRGGRVLAVDGKAMRATLRGANPIHLLAVLDQATSIVLAQVNVDAKTNEVRHKASCHIPGSSGRNSEGGRDIPPEWICSVIGNGVDFEMHVYYRGRGRHLWKQRMVAKHGKSVDVSVPQDVENRREGKAIEVMRSTGRLKAQGLGLEDVTGDKWMRSRLAGGR